MEDSVIRLPEVIKITGLSRSTIYLRVEQATFPKQLSLGVRAVGWRRRDVEDWLASLCHKPTHNKSL